MRPEEAFGIIIKELRTKLEISQESLAEKSSLDRTFISMLERGKRTPTISTLLKISFALDVTSYEVMEKVESLLKK